jgi:hypothetical protein
MMMMMMVVDYDDECNGHYYIVKMPDEMMCVSMAHDRGAHGGRLAVPR